MEGESYSVFQDQSLDRDLKALGLRYLPWVGRDYTLHSRRILIVPESAYDWAPGDASAKSSLANDTFLRSCVREQGLVHSMADPYPSAVHQRMYRGTERMFWNERDVAPVQRERLWLGAAVQQFVQRPMKEKSTRPTGEDYMDGAAKLLAVMRVLRPTLCIFLGTDGHKLNALSSAFKEINRHEAGVAAIGRSHPKIFDALTLDPICRVLMVKHPSRFFSWRRWADFLRTNSQGIVEEFQVNPEAK